MDVPQAIRELIMLLHGEGNSVRKIAAIIKRPKSTVSDIIQLYQKTGNVSSCRKGRCGRRRSLTTRDEKAVARASTINPTATAREIRSSVGGNTASVSLCTIRRSLIRQGRLVYRPLKCPSLDAAKRSVRLKWCRQFAAWTVENWKKVRIFIFFCVKA